MSAFLLSVHVIAAILAVGPIAVAASMFPRYATASAGVDGQGRPAAMLLHRICRVYAAVALAVPVAGFATAVSMGVLGDAWVLVSIALTAAAAVVLIAFVLPGQRAALDGATATRLAMATGMFNLLWVVVTVLMIVRPGSSTGV
jgi:hypothetical protein